MWRSGDQGASWVPTSRLDALPSSSEWASPPRPTTHHVRWIACHPSDPDRLWVAIEAGAPVMTNDGGASWTDRVRGGPRDTHELAVHPAGPERLHVAAGDGPFISVDGGRSWTREDRGLDPGVGYMRSVACDAGDPETVLISGASGPRSAYVAGRADGRVYRRRGRGPWSRVVAGWSKTPSTIAPLLRAGTRARQVWAADERGAHVSDDGGRTWAKAVAFDPTPATLNGLVIR